MKFIADAPTELKELPKDQRIIGNPMTAAFIIIAIEALLAVSLYIAFKG